MKISDLRNMSEDELLNKSTKELEKLLVDTTKIINTKRRNLEKEHLRYSPSLRNLERKKWWRTPNKDKRTKGDKQEAKYRGKLINKITIGKQFLTDQSSSVRGMKKLNRELQKRLEMNYQPSERFLKKFWHIYDEARTYAKELGINLESERVQSLIFNKMNGVSLRSLDEEEILKSIKSSMDNISKMERKNYESVDIFKKNIQYDDDDEPF